MIRRMPGKRLPPVRGLVQRGRHAPLLRETSCPFPVLKGKRVLFASDMHLRDDEGSEAVRGVCRTILAPESDLILLGGDVAENEKALDMFLSAWSREEKSVPVYCVRGNNDRLPDFKERMEAHGIRVLINETAEEFGGRLLLCGTDDSLFDGADYGILPPRDKNRVTLLLSHFPILPESGNLPDILLAGHTHAGQINLMGLDPYTLRSERLYLGLIDRQQHYRTPCVVRGSRNVNGVFVLVTPGMGTSRMPLRIGAPAGIDRLIFD